jgi:hypothetical protein
MKRLSTNEVIKKGTDDRAQQFVARTRRKAKMSQFLG